MWYTIYTVWLTSKTWALQWDHLTAAHSEVGSLLRCLVFKSVFVKFIPPHPPKQQSSVLPLSGGRRGRTGKVPLAWGNCRCSREPAVEGWHIWQGQSGLSYQEVWTEGSWGSVTGGDGWGPLMHVACCCCSWWGGEEGQWYLLAPTPTPTLTNTITHTHAHTHPICQPLSDEDVRRITNQHLSTNEETVRHQDIKC